MASPSAATPDTPITLKISFQGATRRVKLPLRDLGASTLENKLRDYLHIPVGTSATIERYSDSAAAYVVLEPSNMSVYKQLFRAAKAKQKLKLRVSTPDEPSSDKGPKPVSIEDEPEPLQEQVASVPTSNTPSQTTEQSTPTPATSPNTIIAPQTAEDFPEFVQQWRARGMPGIHVRRDGSGKEVVDFQDRTAKNGPLVTMDPLAEDDLSNAQYRFSQAASTLFASELQQESEEKSNPEVKHEEDVKPRVTPVQETKCPAFTTRFRRPFTVCCNRCDRAVPDAHFHCSTCDDGDFDLCQQCVNQGISCYNDQHWLIKRTIKNGQIAYSTTSVAPKSTRAQNTNAVVPAPPSTTTLPFRPVAPTLQVPTTFTCNRTCNACVQEFPEKEFLHCGDCDDFDLCATCFAKNRHGHHPKHSFAPAVAGTSFSQSVTTRLTPGRDVAHNAICDGCETYIKGIRHKCLDCPDWDYCSDCIVDAKFVHPDHRFTPIYETLTDPAIYSWARTVHYGICCDGPLCSTTSRLVGQKYISGVRYKCAVCHDVDFCASCEASPSNKHNKTHPLIKFKTPVRHVSVTTTGEHENGRLLPTMGDRTPSRVSQKDNRSSRWGQPVSSPSEHIAVNPVQTVVDVQPTEATIAALPIKAEEVEEKKNVTESKQTPIFTPVFGGKAVPDLIAVFQRDTVEDGTIFPPNHTFEQTWVMRNEGKVAWPAGCSVKFVGGDYMGAVDPLHPIGVRELISANESTVCYNELQPGQEFSFTVLMRTPERQGKVISYWRLTAPSGEKFGHKLWCDVTVEAPAPKIKEEATETSLLDSEVPQIVKSQMIIPKLEHESPASSVHVSPAEHDLDVATETDTLAPSVHENEDEFEECTENDEWADESADGFMTDEEYDILDASDEEFFFEQHKMVSKN